MFCLAENVEMNFFSHKIPPYCETIWASVGENIIWLMTRKYAWKNILLCVGRYDGAETLPF